MVESETNAAPGTSPEPETGRPMAMSGVPVAIDDPPATVGCHATLLEAALIETALLETELLERALLRQIGLANSTARTESATEPTRTRRFGQRARLRERGGRP
jgi:hypothetical protein